MLDERSSSFPESQAGPQAQSQRQPESESQQELAVGAYSEADVVAALRSAGVARGDLLFVHADLEALGDARACDSAEQRAALALRALRLALGDTGTLVVPVYTFSFCRQERFDEEGSATAGGPWSPSVEFLEGARHLPGALRSGDPIHSVVALGPAAHALLDGLPSTCFGPDSLQHRLRLAGGKICAIGLGLHELTMVHHAEVMMSAPFRYKKLFTGEITRNGETRRAGWVYDVRMPGRSSELDAARIGGARREPGLAREADVGRGTLHVVDAQRLYEFLCAGIAVDPWFTVKGPPLPERPRQAGADGGAAAGAGAAAIALPADASMETIVRTLWRVPRDIISDGYDAALAALGTQLPMRVHEYPTGTGCFTWIVPERWTCHEAWLETLDGRRLFAYADHPLHVVSYSLPFDGIVSREELLRHLHVHERLPDAIPFIFKYYERDWGLCCSRRLRDSLREPQYRVVIRTTSDYGALKVGEVIVPGATDESIVLCAHLCHPAMAVDDLTGVAVGVDVMRALRRRQTPLRYTYRLLILPETIGSLAYLSDHASLIPHLKGGLFLEMLGLDHPHALQRSFAADTDVDACFMAALRSGDPYGWTAPYRDLVGNDERQFNAPGVRVPMLQLLRVLPPSHVDYPYREYHSSFDTPDIVSWRRLDESRDLVLRMIDTLEGNRVPINRFSGEVCCSRHGLHIDWWENPEGHRALFRIMDLIDGTRTIVDIARACGTTPEVVAGVLDALDTRGLIGWRDEHRGASAPGQP
jgi:aminopeptidase-like protein/aminoglycoside N3'-acetyltransferase